MERPDSVLRQRATSFNPEAAAFSPVVNSTPSQGITPALTTSQTPVQDSDCTSAMAPIFNYSPFLDAGSERSLYRRDPLTPGPVRLEDFLSPDVQALVKKLEEHPGIQEMRPPSVPRSAPVVEVARHPTPRLPPFTFPAPAPEIQPDYDSVDINELSAGLGLPSARADREDASTLVSHGSRVPQAHDGALYGLAEFLQKQDTNTPSRSPAAPLSTPTRTTIPHKTQRTPKRSSPRSAKENNTPTPRRIAIPTPTKTITATPDPSTHHQHRRNSSNVSYSHHTRVPSHRRFTRRLSRATKRSDQGPMPSAADIYPDDAHVAPTPIFEGHAQSSFQPPYIPQQVREPTPVILNPFNWPPPAQVYAPESPPTLADMHAADADVLKLMDELPSPNLCTLAKLGNTHDLRVTSAFGLEDGGLAGDERPLTPKQLDGSRYGMRFWGLGYGDQWELAPVGEFGAGKHFRVRPREHEGWGGWEWAAAKGWGA